MNYSEIRYYLHNLDGLKEDIKMLQSDIDDYQNMQIDTVTISRLTHMPRSPRTETSHMETIVIDRLSHIMRLENQLLYYKTMYRAINSTVNKLNTVETTIVNMRYLEREIGKRQPTYEDICRATKFCISYVKYIDNRICQRIERQFDILIR